MGNEHSAASPSTSSSISAHSSNAGVGEQTRAAASKGIVVVRPGVEHPVGDPKDDEILKRVQEIPQFYPILRSALHQSGVRDPPDLFKRMNPRPILLFCNRIQDHLHIAANVVAKEENAIIQRIREVDFVSATLVNKLTERDKHQERMAKEIQNVRDLADQICKVQVLLQSLVPCVETLNELLVPDSRLPSLNLGRFLERTPKPSITSSSESSTQTTPAHRVNAGVELHIAAVDEQTVVDADR